MVIRPLSYKIARYIVRGIKWRRIYVGLDILPGAACLYAPQKKVPRIAIIEEFEASVVS